ncbi:MAG: ABC transporter substrate-binding protein [Planctomycetota bacterium]|nr:ABC transporter substrate-binding protein [Planctomycetota bacterium]
MKHTQYLIVALPILGLLLIPFLFSSPSTSEGDSDAPRIVIVTPHNEQIRDEFENAFEAWHAKRYGETIEVEWSVPGGTTEIRRLLVARHEQALREGRGASGDADLFFGGGSYEFTKLAIPTAMDTAAGKVSASILAPADISDSVLAEVFPQSTLAGRALYDTDKRWFSTALSTFGIVSNPAICARLGVPVPESWEDLADPRLVGWIAMTNPGQSGSVLTAFETILLRKEWRTGWHILLRAGANARNFSGSSSDIPKRVSTGVCAAGVCIDFYARFESQAMRDAATIVGDPALDRVRYTAPVGATVIDPDPIALLTGAPNPELATRFILFTLMPEGQALWQFRRGAESPSGLHGPRKFELRRLPARKDMYAKYASLFIDNENPFLFDEPMPAGGAVRPLIPTIFNALVIQPRAIHEEAWLAIISHPAYPKTTSGHAPIVSSDDVSDPQLSRWIQLFDALPNVPAPGGTELSLENPASLEAIRAGWLGGGWKSEGLWPKEEDPESALRRLLTRNAIARYKIIVDEAKSAGILNP